MEITHVVVHGRYVQTVSPERLAEILDEAGESHDRPDWMALGDEWTVAD